MVAFVCGNACILVVCVCVCDQLTIHSITHRSLVVFLILPFIIFIMLMAHPTVKPQTFILKLSDVKVCVY